MTLQDDNTRLYHEWYANPVVITMMMPYFVGREAAFFVDNDDTGKNSARHINIPTKEGLLFWMKCLHMWEKAEQGVFYDFYASLATYGDGKGYGVPFRSGRMESINTAWWNEHWRHMKAYDILIDLDAHKGNVVSDAHKVKAYLDKHEIDHSMRCSGEGMHFILPVGMKNYDPGDDGSAYHIGTQYLKVLRRDLKLSSIDVDILDSRRVCRVPWSLNMGKDRRPYVCVPLRDIGDFKEKREIEYWREKLRDAAETEADRRRGK